MPLLKLLQQNSLALQGLQGSHLFLTGCTGWLGRNLLEALHLANQGLGINIRATILTRNSKSFAAAAPHLSHAPFVTFLEGDVRDFEFPRGHFSHLLHAATTAAQETFEGASPASKFHLLIDGTRHVLAFARAAGIQQVLFTSSGIAASMPKDGSTVEETDLSAPSTIEIQTALGQGKRAAEFLCTLYAEETGANVTIARCFSFIGPYMPLNIHYALGNFIQSALENRPLIIQGDGSPVRSYLHTGDLAIWLLALLLRTGAPRIYNVGSDEAFSILDLAQIVRNVLNPNGDIQILGHTNQTPGNPVRNHYVPNITRAKTELGLRVWTPLEEGISAFQTVSPMVETP